MTIGLNLSGSTTFTGGGGVFRIQLNNAAVMWICRQLSFVSSTPTTSAAKCRVRASSGYVDTGYFAGSGDVCGGEPPIYMRVGDFIEGTWYDGAAGEIGYHTMWYDEIIL